MEKFNFKNFSLDEVLTKDELKKIVGGNGSGCVDYLCVCGVDDGEGGGTPVTSYQTFCSVNDMIEFLKNCADGSGCDAVG